MTPVRPGKDFGSPPASRLPTSQVQGLVPRPDVRRERRPGLPEGARALSLEPFGLKRRGAVVGVGPKTDAAGYAVRLVDSDGRAGGEIALLSIDVAGALREVCLHSPDRSGFELWQKGRMILRFYRLPAEDGTPVQPV